MTHCGSPSYHFRCLQVLSMFALYHGIWCGHQRHWCSQLDCSNVTVHRFVLPMILHAQHRQNLGQNAGLASGPVVARKYPQVEVYFEAKHKLCAVVSVIFRNQQIIPLTANRRIMHESHSGLTGCPRWTSMLRHTSRNAWKPSSKSAATRPALFYHVPFLCCPWKKWCWMP